MLNSLSYMLVSIGPEFPDLLFFNHSFYTISLLSPFMFLFNSLLLYHEATYTGLWRHYSSGDYMNRTPGSALGPRLYSNTLWIELAAVRLVKACHYIETLFDQYKPCAESNYQNNQGWICTYVCTYMYSQDDQGVSGRQCVDHRGFNRTLTKINCPF